MAWKIGLRPSARPGLTASTTCLKGMSAWSSAAMPDSRARPISWLKEGAPDRSARSRTVLTKRPIRSRISSSPRAATGVARGMSSPAPRAESSAATPAQSAVNSVVPCLAGQLPQPGENIAGYREARAAAAPGRATDGRPVIGQRQPLRKARQRGAPEFDAPGQPLAGSAGSPSSARCQSAKSA